MVTPLENITQRLLDIGFFDILTFALVSAIFYGLLKKSKIFEGNVFLDGVVSIVIGFFTLLYKIVTGVSLLAPLATFFTQWFSVLLAFFIGAIVASMFYPDLPKMLGEQFKRRSTLWAMIALGIGLFVTSGLISTFISGLGGGGQGKPGTAPGPPTDVIIIGAGLIIFIVILLIAASTTRGEE
ncbi:MAG: hypothetical protein J7L39_00750 [Candidatus Aenigmarchaeota archaeon]|nr:hypothetical protein [Candidatus Aenigmarchaeota archaeon]